MEADLSPDLITLIKTEDGVVIKTEIKEEPTGYNELEPEWDPLNGYVPEDSTHLDPEYDSEEELPLPSQVVIKEEQFSDDEVATDGGSESSVHHEVVEPTAKNAISNGLASCGKEAVKVNGKPFYTRCPFCEKITVRANFSSHHLPRCKMWKKHLGLKVKEDSNIEDSESSSTSLDQPEVVQDSTNNIDGSTCPTIEVRGQSPTAQCPFCKMAVSRALYSSLHLPRCTMWKKYLCRKGSPGGRPLKRRSFNFQKRRPKRYGITEELGSEQEDEEFVVYGYQANLSNQEHSHIPHLRTSRPVRKAKTACIEKLSQVYTDLEESQREETAERNHLFMRNKRLSETAEERERQLIRMQVRPNQLIAEETPEQRSESECDAEEDIQ